MKVIIIGGGIGGAAAALAMVRQGLDVTVLEQAKAMSEVGAGLQVGANGSRVLRQLGVLDEFRKRAVHAQSYRIVHFETGEIIHDHPLGSTSEDHYGEPAFEAHRADLLDVMVQALPRDVVRTNARCMGIEHTSNGVIVSLENGENLHADVVIGADGVHSMVRRSLFGEEEPVFSGTAAWRSLIPGDKVKALGFEERFHGWRGAGRIAIGYWVRSENLFNFAAFVPASELRRESWSQRGDHQDLKDALSGCEPLLAKLVDVASENFITAMYYRRPLDTWTKGRVTLLGDAAHAMLPYMAQGAVQSMEDGLVLAGCLAKVQSQGLTIEQALVEYEARRRPRTTRVQHNVLGLREFWFATDPVKRLAGMRRMQAQDRMDPLAESQWSWVYHYDALKEVEAPLGFTPAMPASRAEHEAVWPRAAAQQDWHNVFTFDDYSGGNDGMRSGYERYFATQHTSMQRTLGGVNCLEVAAPSSSDKVIVHMHGGGYTFGSAKAAIGYAHSLACAAGAKVICVDYRLAPEYPYPAPLDDLQAVYQALLSEGVKPEQLYFSGESAGAGIALATLMTLRDQGSPMPQGMVALSPFADMTLSGESVLVNGFIDAFMHKDQLLNMASSYCQTYASEDPRLSPVFGDFSQLPPLLLVAARDEALASDAIRIAHKAQAAGVKARLVLADSATHAFAVFPGALADDAFELMGNFIAGLNQQPAASKTIALDRRAYELIQRLSQGV